jgi:hypothetical protein
MEYAKRTFKQDHEPEGMVVVMVQLENESKPPRNKISIYFIIWIIFYISILIWIITSTLKFVNNVISSPQSFLQLQIIPHNLLTFH